MIYDTALELMRYIFATQSGDECEQSLNYQCHDWKQRHFNTPSILSLMLWHMTL
jgi:hypothetical protein